MKKTESAYLNEDERKKLQKKTEEELKHEEERILQLEKKKEIIHEEEAISDDLQKLRDLLEEHIIDDELVEKVLSESELDHEEIEEIFEKIDAIEDIDGIDDYLPQDMRVSKDEYAQATHDDEALIVVLTKIDTALGQIAHHSSPQAWGSINLFSGFLTMLDKNLITIQEHHIDMQDALQSDKKQKPLWIWETIKESFR